MALRDTMLKSKNGKILFDWISPIYDDCKIMIQIYNALGKQFDDLDAMFEDFSKQMFPQTATWGLKIWEKRLDLPVNDSLDDDDRRGNIISKLQSRVTINPITMEEIVRNETGAEITVQEWIKDYTFKVLINPEAIPKHNNICKTIKRIKPSHMSFIIQYDLSSEHKMYIGAHTQMSKVITISPHKNKPIEVESQLYNASAKTIIAQKTTHTIKHQDKPIEVKAELYEASAKTILIQKTTHTTEKE